MCGALTLSIAHGHPCLSPPSAMLWGFNGVARAKREPYDFLLRVGRAFIIIENCFLSLLNREISLYK